MVLLIGLVGSRHLCTILVTTGVSLSAFTRMFLAFLIDVDWAVLSITYVRAREGQSCLLSVLALLDVVGPDLYRVSTMEVRSEVSCILHVKSLPLLLNEEDFIPGK